MPKRTEAKAQPVANVEELAERLRRIDPDLTAGEALEEARGLASSRPDANSEELAEFCAVINKHAKAEEQDRQAALADLWLLFDMLKLVPPAFRQERSRQLSEMSFRLIEQATNRSPMCGGSTERKRQDVDVLLAEIDRRYIGVRDIVLH
jgi:hypothetical protein